MKSSNKQRHKLKHCISAATLLLMLKTTIIINMLLAPAASIGNQDSGVISFSLEEMARAQSSEKTANHVSVVSQLDFKKIIH